MRTNVEDKVKIVDEKTIQGRIKIVLKRAELNFFEKEEFGKNYDDIILSLEDIKLNKTFKYLGFNSANIRIGLLPKSSETKIKGHPQYIPTKKGTFVKVDIKGFGEHYYQLSPPNK